MTTIERIMLIRANEQTAIENVKLRERKWYNEGLPTDTGRHAPDRIMIAPCIGCQKRKVKCAGRGYCRLCRFKLQKGYSVEGDYPSMTECENAKVYGGEWLVFGQSMPELSGRRMHIRYNGQRLGALLGLTRGR